MDLANVRYDSSSVMSSNSQPSDKLVLIFDPGGTTGVALLDSDGAILRTEAYSPSETLVYAQRMKVRHSTFQHTGQVTVVIEKGPEWQQHSPITRSVEVKLQEIFPKAHLVTPNRWKGHPASKCTEKVPTRHEKDAVRLGRWFLSTQGSISAKDENEVQDEVVSRKERTITSPTHAARARRINHRT